MGGLSIDYELELMLLRHWACSEHEWRFDVAFGEYVCICGARRKLDEAVQRRHLSYQPSPW